MKKAARTDAPANGLILSFSVVIEPDGDRFHAFCPAFKGLHVDGGTKDEAVANTVQAVQVYVASLARNKEPLPVGPHLEIESREELPQIPEGAFLQYIQVQWPFHDTSGNN